METINFKFMYEIDNKLYYMKFGKYSITCIIDESENWMLSHEYELPTSDEISNKIIELSQQINSKMSLIEKVTRWIEQCIEDDENEFIEDVDNNTNVMVNKKILLPELIVKSDRNLQIVVWGRKIRDKVPSNFKIEHNFNACVLHGKKQGIDWRNDARDPDVRMAVMTGKSFYEFIDMMINVIERNNLQRISVNCAKGRHRSVTCAIVLKEYYYPLAEIIFLEL